MAPARGTIRMDSRVLRPLACRYRSGVLDILGGRVDRLITCVDHLTTRVDRLTSRERRLARAIMTGRAAHLRRRRRNDEARDPRQHLPARGRVAPSKTATTSARSRRCSGIAMRGRR